MIIEQTIDMAGKIRIIWECPDSKNTYQFKFESQPTEEFLLELGKYKNEQLLLDNVQQLSLGVEDTLGVIPQAINAIKTSTDNNFGNYLLYINNLDWKTQATLKLFMYNLTIKLTNSSAFNEEESYTIVYDYIKSKSEKELEKLFNTTL